MRSSAEAPAKPGDRIELIEMGVDPRTGKSDPAPIPPGTQGTVLDCVPGIHPGTFQVVDWDIERSLQLITPVDRFLTLSSQAEA